MLLPGAPPGSLFEAEQSRWLTDKEDHHGQDADPHEDAARESSDQAGHCSTNATPREGRVDRRDRNFDWVAGALGARILRRCAQEAAEDRRHLRERRRRRTSLLRCAI